MACNWPIIDWSKTKNGKPHAIPVPEVAAELIESIKPNAHGWFFPSAMDPTKPVIGFESEAAFSRAFKKAVGVSPDEWRRQQPS